MRFCKSRNIVEVIKQSHHETAHNKGYAALSCAKTIDGLPLSFQEFFQIRQI